MTVAAVEATAATSRKKCVGMEITEPHTFLSRLVRGAIQEIRVHRTFGSISPARVLGSASSEGGAWRMLMSLRRQTAERERRRTVRGRFQPP